MTLSELQQIVGNSIRMTREIQNVWVQAELSDFRTSGGHGYMELVEKDDSGMIRAKLRAMIWSSTLLPLRRKFYDATGRDLATGLKVLVRGTVTHHNVFGIAFTIGDIDPSYTLGDIERLRREILERLTREGIINRNKQLAAPEVPQRIAVISAEGTAGYGDFMNQLRNNPDGYAVYTGLFPAVMQGERTVNSVMEALEKVRFTQDQWDAVAIIRGGGATTDLNSFDNYDLARAVALFPIPVIVGIGHERDRTVLDEIACVRCKTPTAVAEYIINSLRMVYTRMTELVRRIIKYSSESLKGEHLRLANLSQGIPSYAKNRVMRERLELDKTVLKLKTAAQNALGNEQQRLKRLDDILRILRPENTLQRGYSITRINGKALTEASNIKAGDKIETTLATGKITSTVI